MKRSREFQANALESEQVKNENIDLKSNTTLVTVDCQSQKHSELVGKMVFTNPSINSRSVNLQEVRPLSNHMGTDDILKTKDVKSYSVEIVKTLLKFKNEDNIVSLCQGNNMMELDLGFNVVNMRGEVLEDEAPSKLGENL